MLGRGRRPGGRQGPVRMPLDLQGCSFVTFKDKRTEMAGPTGELIPWLAPEVDIISDMLSRIIVAPVFKSPAQFSEPV